jgi:PAS domain S-box-containing protein
MPAHTVLLIDDNIHDRFAFKRYLGSGYTCDEAETGEEALQMLQQRRYACVLLDFHLPDMNGLEFLVAQKTICKSNANAQRGLCRIPVIMVTGTGSESIAVQSLKQGAYDYLVKEHVTPELLHKTIQSVLQKADYRRRLRKHRRQLAKVTDQLSHQARLIDMVSDAIISTDLRFIIQSWNKGAERIYGWHADEVIGKDIRQVIPVRFLGDNPYGEIPAQLPAHQTPEQIEAQNHGYIETLQQRRDGEWRVVLTSNSLMVDANGDVIGVVGASHDITELRDADKTLREQQRFTARITEVTPDIVYIYDLVERQNVYANRSVHKALGYTKESVNLSNAVFFNSLIHPDDAKRDITNPAHFVDMADGEFLEVEFRICDATGTWRWFNSRNTVFSRQAFEQQKELSDLKSRFVSMASHEFRTPLTSIMVSAETLTRYRDRLTEDQINKHLNRIRQQVLYMRDMMEDVLQLARLQAGNTFAFKATRGDLDALCRDIIEEFEPDLQPEKRILYECPMPIVPLYFDERLMRQVISNVLSNALKYSPAEQAVQMRLEQNGSSVKLQVTDGGIGIPDADRKYLFDPFHRGKNVGTIPGTGLGLSIAKQAVETHGGTISITSQVNIGTTITIAIPMTAAVMTNGRSPNGAAQT